MRISIYLKKNFFFHDKQIIIPRMKKRVMSFFITRAHIVLYRYCMLYNATVAHKKGTNKSRGWLIIIIIPRSRSLIYTDILASQG